MPQTISSTLYPVMLMQDRYAGTYSGGEWIAIREANRVMYDAPRIVWLLENGPSAGDVEAAAFWHASPDWIASGPTPDQAILALLNKQGLPARQT